jgi:hypothetical protein
MFDTFPPTENLSGMKILLNQKFGLGNQLFQYAAGLYFAKKYDAELEIIREHEEIAASYGHPRPFLLSNFEISTPVRERNLFDRLLRSKSGVADRVMAPLRRVMGAHSHDPYFAIVGDFQSSLSLPAFTRTLYLNGHFQARQYAQSMESQLRSELRFREPPSGKNLAILSQIRDCECPVSLHVRRGDYTVGWRGQNLLPMSYYNHAIRAIRDMHPNAAFFVFSDDIPGAREALGQLERTVFVDHNTEDTAHEDLRLISACRHHILANSTFSWWGAWLNPKPEKIVLVPDPWHRTDPHPHLISPAWRRIPALPPTTSIFQDSCQRLV